MVHRMQIRGCVVLVGLLGACGGPSKDSAEGQVPAQTAPPAELGTCSDGSDLVWADVSPIFAAHCTHCHHADLATGERQGAPVGLDYDTADTARRNGFVTWSAVYSTAMPPEPPAVSEPEAWLLWEWLSCGGPP